MIKYSTFLLLLVTSSLVIAQVDLPVTFDDPAITYELTDFGDNSSSVVADPADATNKVAMSTKPASAPLWAGTTIGPATGFTKKIPFTATETKMSVRVYSPDAGIQIRLKCEESGDPTKSVETEATTTKVNEWETLTFDFSKQVDGTALLNLGYSYDKASIFFNFGVDGATAGEKTYYWDDVMFVPAGPMKNQINLPVKFEDTMVDHTMTDFGGNASSVVADPADAMNHVAMSVKSNSAETWAGTTCGTAFGFKDAIPFTATETKMSVRVYSPDAGTPIRLKVEDAGDPTKSCETEVKTTMANGWEVLVFDFSMEASGTAKLDLANTYNKASIFFNFGTDGATAGEKTYYWDDMMFGEPANSSIEALSANTVGFHPNPVNDVLRITAATSLHSVKVFNTFGQLIGEFEASGTSAELDMTSFASGIYVFVVDTEVGEQSFKAIKN